MEYCDEVVFFCQLTYLKNRTSQLYQLFGLYMLLVTVVRLSVGVVAIHVNYFRFFDDVVFTHNRLGIGLGDVKNVHSQSDSTRVITSPGAKFDVYDCLVVYSMRINLLV